MPFSGTIPRHGRPQPERYHPIRKVQKLREVAKLALLDLSLGFPFGHLLCCPCLRIVNVVRSTSHGCSLWIPKGLTSRVSVGAQASLTECPFLASASEKLPTMPPPLGRPSKVRGSCLRLAHPCWRARSQVPEAPATHRVCFLAPRVASVFLLAE